ncbi:MAG: InlB B-repeat-containing protein, partial [Anaerolineae bacterium]
TTLRAYVDDTAVLTVTDTVTPFLSGQCALGSYEGDVQFDDVLVTDLSIFGLTVSKAGSGNGTVTSVPEGIDCGVTCTAGFAAGTVVSLTATPDSGDSFVGWMGACSGAGECLVTMDAAKDVTAVFSAPSEPTLVVYTDGEGSGTVTSEPAGIDCGTACAAGFSTGATVTLTAAADVGSTFVGWSGACSGTGDCVLMMNADTMVTATFMLGPFDLNVTKAGNGDGNVTSDPAGIDCGITCTAEFDAGTVVTLTATADVDSIFTGWSGGGCSGTGDCIVTMLADTDVVATFQSLTQTLTVAKTGNGAGLVTSDPAGIDCGTSCTADYPYGTVVTLTAVADGNSVFAGWSGAGCSGTDACVVTLEDATTVEARFMALIQTLSVVKTGSGTGSVASDPAGIACGATCSAEFGYGETVTLTATPGANSGFAGWSGGGCSGDGDCVVTVDDAITITAEFEFYFTLPFTDDFESGSGKWTVVDGDWSTVVEGDGNTIYRQSDTSGYDRSVVGAPNWTDYAFQARVKPGSKYGKLIARYQDVEHYYFFMAVRADNGKIEFKKMVGSGSTGLGSANAGIATGEWYTATFEVVGNELRGYINGTLVYTTTDDDAGGVPPYTWGRIGFGTLDSTADFDDVWVDSLVPMYPLTVTKSGSGSGIVTSDPAGLIDCGATCSAVLAEGTVVTLTATPDAGDTFAGWLGACSGTGDCVITMDEAREVEAVFASESSPMLIVYKIGTGTGVITSTPPGIDCGDTCSAYFTTESAAIPVTLVATPGPFSEFTGWEGACSGTGPCYVTVDTSKSVTATFTYLTYPLTVIKAGNGSGTVTSEPPGIDCGETCSATMGGVVTLSAVADPRSWFKGWDGAGCSDLDTCEVTMDAAQSVTATFVSYLTYLPLVLKNYPPIPVVVDPLYVAPDGNDDNPGTLDEPFATLDQALSVIVAGQTVYMRGGVYSHTQTISLTQSGNFVNMYKIWAYPGEQPVLDFSGSPAGARGFVITGKFWHLKGLEIQYAQDNAIKIDGSYNIVENCVMHHNQDTGLQIGLGSSSVNPNGTLAAYNQIINCDSYRNFDEATNGSNADGFACKLHAGKGNSFTGCRAWENADDGWDLFDTDYPVTIDSSWTWHNGDRTLFGNPATWGGNGNGFKVGGNYDNASHILRNCIAFDNAYESGKGFDQNHNMSGITIYNSVAWGNLINFSFNETPNDGSHHVLHNNVSFDPVTADTNIVADSVQDYNSWTLTVTAMITDFLSLDETLAKAPRQADGSLPDNDFARLVAGSDLIDAGMDVDLPYCGAAPDLGAFEFCP